MGIPGYQMKGKIYAISENKKNSCFFFKGAYFCEPNACLTGLCNGVDEETYRIFLGIDCIPAKSCMEYMRLYEL